MKKTFLIFTAFIFLLIPTISEGGKWVFISESGKGNKFYVDAISRKKISKNIGRAWVKTEYKQPNKNNISYQVAYKEHDCKERKSRDLQIVKFSNKGEKYGFTYDDSKWIFVIPASAFAIVHNFVCHSSSIEDREAIKVVPSVTIDELNNIIIPPASTDKKEVIKEKPFSTEEAKTFKKITYSVHIGAFLIEENAVSLVNKFKQKGYEPFIRKVLRNNNETIHRVLIGNFEDKDKALEQSKIIREKEGLNSFVYYY